MIRFLVWTAVLIAGVLIAIWSANDGSGYNGADLFAAVLVIVAIWRLATLPEPADSTNTPQEHQ